MSRKVPISDIKAVNTKTGELFDGHAFIIPKKSGKFTQLFGQEAFMIAAQRAYERMSLDPGMKESKFRTLMYLMAKCSYDNYIVIPQKEIVESTGLDRTSVFRAIKYLIENEYILEGPTIGKTKSYMLDPNVGFKGDPSGKVHKTQSGKLKLIVDNCKMNQGTI